VGGKVYRLHNANENDLQSIQSFATTISENRSQYFKGATMTFQTPPAHFRQADRSGARRLLSAGILALAAGTALEALEQA
jgi:hypothetical protein